MEEIKEEQKWINNTNHLGYMKSPEDVRDYKLCSANNPTVEYPKEFKLDNLPKVKQQGNVSSCCAHASSSILEYYDHNNHRLSTNFIYGIQNKLFGRENMGMYLIEACKIMQQYGDMQEDDCSGNYEIPAVWSIAEASFNKQEKLDKAYKFRVMSYYLCSTDNDIKYALMNYGPVLAGMMWKDRYRLSRDYTIEFDQTSSGGGHAVMIYGWNEKGWLIQNSWGEEFADHGRFVLPYSYGLLEARALIDDPEWCGDVVLSTPHKNTPKFIIKVLNYFKNLKKKDAK